MSKLLQANPERHSASVPDAPHIRSIATVGDVAVCNSNRNVPEPTSAPICMTLRTYVTDRPRPTIPPASHPPTFPMMKYAAHGAAESNPAFARLTLNVVLK